jgi:hypothetical protein
VVLAVEMLLPVIKLVVEEEVLVVLELEHHCLLRLAQNIQLPLELVAQVLHQVKVQAVLIQYFRLLLLLVVEQAAVN